MHELLNKAHRRLITQLLLDKGAMALTVVLGGAILLLLTGTQILDWYWLLLLAVAGFGVGVYQLRGRIPTKYRVAQRIDRRMQLADTLSTAQYFEEHPDPARQSVCDLQRISAESAARTVDVSAALPFVRSRYLLPAAALAAAVLVLFGVRYAFTGSLDLSTSLVAIAMDNWFGAPTELAKNDFKKGLKSPEQGAENSPNQYGDNQEQLPESLMENTDVADPSTVETSDSRQAKDGEKGKQGDEQGDQKQDGDDQEQDNDQKSDSKDGKEGDSKDSKQSNPKESSVLDKMRDALANMLNKMKSDSPKQSQNGQSQKSKSQQDPQKEQSDKDAKSSSEQNSGDQNADSQQEQNDAKGGRPDKPPQQESANSLGDKIGDKKIKDAAMLEAMGKITELLSKRQQMVTGEVMVEVGSTKQQLKTPFQQQQASHADSGSEIHRDEVPLLYQQFVEQYFEEIRKPDNKPKSN